VQKLSHVEKIRIPASLDYKAVRGLRRECALKLAEIRPTTLGQASRVSGVSPADIGILMIVIESGRGVSSPAAPLSDPETHGS
jgi:tRNA uridine 5-carboxymethylaminomethyl modification enzyme